MVILELLNTLHHNILHHNYPYFFLFAQAQLHTYRCLFWVCIFLTTNTGLFDLLQKSELHPCDRYSPACVTVLLWIHSALCKVLHKIHHRRSTKTGWVMVSAQWGLWKSSSTSDQYHGKDNIWDQCKNVRRLFRKVLYCHALPPQRHMKPQKPSFSIRIVTNFVHYQLAQNQQLFHIDFQVWHHRKDINPSYSPEKTELHLFFDITGDKASL